MDPPGARVRHRSTPPHGGVREDCWSEGATEALVEAWGDRFVELKRGNLRQKDWQDVADAVNDHQDALKRPRRTDVQCKNRIDTLKKKFKIEKGRRGASQWPFFSRLEELIGTAATAGSGSGSGSATLKKHQTPKSEPNRMPPQRQGLTLKLKNRPGSNARPLAYRMDSPPGSSERSHGDSADGVDDDGDGYDDVDDRRDEDDDGADGHEGRGLLPLGMMSVPKKRRWDGGGGAEDAFGELAKAIVKFGEIYERVESSKQQQMMEMERQRMEFAKELEFQRMQMFMETQLELEKMKRPKYAPNSSKRS